MEFLNDKPFIATCFDPLHYSVFWSRERTSAEFGRSSLPKTAGWNDTDQEDGQFDVKITGWSLF